MISGEATNTNIIVLGLTRLGLEPTICRPFIHACISMYKHASQLIYKYVSWWSH